MGKPVTNLVASIRGRLNNVAHERSEEFQFVLTQYALERLLYRLTQSAHAQVFVLKGAMLFQLWTGHSHRPTRDLDLLGHGEPSTARFETIFRDVCQTSVADDGLVFLAASVRAETIKQSDEYRGIRVHIDARLANARIPLQIDIGFGDAITPGPVAVTYPTLLDSPAPMLQAYPRESVVAEKFQAMVILGIGNSRMKDFFDLWTLANEFEFAGISLSSAIRATFEAPANRASDPDATGFDRGVRRRSVKGDSMGGFFEQVQADRRPASLTEVVPLLETFLMPPVLASAAGKTFSDVWAKGGPWWKSP